MTRTTTPLNEAIPEAVLETPAVRPRRSVKQGFDRNQLIWWLGLLVLAAFVLAPVIPTLYQSIRDTALYDADGVLTLSNYGRLFTEAGFGEVIVNTLVFATLTTVFTLVIAVPISIVIARTNVPGKRMFESMMQWPFYVSSLILALGWVIVYGPAGYLSQAVRGILGTVPWNLYTLPGMAVTEAVAISPIVYMFCRNALLQSDASLEEAARTTGAGPLRILLTIVVPMMRPAMIYSVILVFSISVETLSVPLIFGTPAEISVFSSFLYTNGLQSLNPDYGILGAASVLILLVTVSLVVVQTQLLKNARRFVSVRGKATRPKPLELGWLRWPAVAFVAAYTILGAFIPMAGVIARSFVFVLTPMQNPIQSLTMSNYEKIFTFSAYSGSIVNSLIIATIGSFVLTTACVVFAVISKRSSFRWRRTMEYLALAPQSMPGIIVGIGLFWAFALIPFGGGALIQGTLLALIIGFGFRALPAAFGSVAPAIMQISEELDRAANVSGADWFRTMRSIVVPLVLPAVGSAFVLTFITMFKEYSPAIFLQSADSRVLGTTMLELWAQGITGPVAALATIQIAIISIVVLIAGFTLRGFKHA